MTQLTSGNAVIYELAAANENMTDIDRLSNLYWALLSVLRGGVPGAVVELGCNAGLTSVFFGMVIATEDPARELHLFDSFEGLPKPSAFDAYLKEGDCRTSIDAVHESFAHWGVPLPDIHPGWFEDTLPSQLPSQVAFAYLDGDFYNSILVSLQHVWPQLATGGSILIDDYCDSERNPRAWDGLPGVKKACDDYFGPLGVTGRVLVGSGDLAFIEYRKS
ncbi:TylF/MycF/NovP-related O-methyltransferase [Kitasatospora kifunensis]|uniref:O-methyltransferase n=1 Tax=Kitasatospora kifunensis TaxID=58351 RepID=A0A7W7R7V6_KITKI|nr:TylF/MycF/NovP-related O-methyltransferase [Kitasatospora kifunensis]MBB4926919.1 O-methyltransferase [Kitasatospora kifunensis]